MEELNRFLDILKKYLMVIIIVPLLTIVITFFLVRHLPDSYVSQAQIATGIVDETKQYQEVSILNQAMLQGDQVNQEFSNLIATMSLKQLLDQVSYQLIIHDLTSAVPFKEQSKLVNTLNREAKVHTLEVFKNLYAKKQGLNLSDQDEKGLFNILASMKYDSGSLNEKLSIFRLNSSDFISIQYESENPELSAFVVNTLSTEFVNYYSVLVRTNKVQATNFLAALLKAKSDTLAKKMEVLRNYKIKNRVLNLDEQSKQLYSRIVAYENKKQEAIQDVSSYAGTLNEIDRKFSPGERRYLEASVSKINQHIINTKDELSALYDLYYKNDFEGKYKKSIDSVQNQLTAQINRSSDQYINSPLAAKQALVQQKIDIEIKLDISRYSINALENEINNLNAQFDKLVPREAEVQTYEMGIDIATKEYMDILNKYNQSSLDSDISVKLNVVQLGMPGLPQPSKKMLLVILSGIISAAFCLVVLFVMYLLDTRVISAVQLANKTQLPVIGSINELNISSIDLKDIWKHEALPNAVLELKNQLRSIRYEIENGSKGKILVINSITPDQGKTFTAMSLAFAWMMTNKKVLIIDGNFNNPTISSHTNSSLFVEDFLKSSASLQIDSSDIPIMILKNRGGDKSLIEIADYKHIGKRLELAKEIFDVIIIETASLNIINQSKEWVSFADHVVGVFKYGQNIDEQKQGYVKYLQNKGVFMGWIMNKIPTKD